MRLGPSSHKAKRVVNDFMNEKKKRIRQIQMKVVRDNFGLPLYFWIRQLKFPFQKERPSRPPGLKVECELGGVSYR